VELCTLHIQPSSKREDLFGAAEMIWEVGNFGFDLYLSTTIPKLTGQFVPEKISTLCGNEPIDLWAITLEAEELSRSLLMYTDYPMSRQDRVAPSCVIMEICRRNNIVRAGGDEARTGGGKVRDDKRHSARVWS